MGKNALELGRDFVGAIENNDIGTPEFRENLRTSFNRLEDHLNNFRSYDPRQQQQALKEIENLSEMFESMYVKNEYAPFATSSAKELAGQTAAGLKSLQSQLRM